MDIAHIDCLNGYCSPRLFQFTRKKKYKETEELKAAILFAVHCIL